MAKDSQVPVLAEPSSKKGSTHSYFPLLRQLVVREITETTRDSLLGFLWLVLGPLTNMMLYVIVFGVIFGGSFRQDIDEPSINYAVGVYMGLSFVSLLNEAIAKGANIMTLKTNFVKRIVFPLPFIPLVMVSGSTFVFIVNLALAIILAFIFSSITASLLVWLPLILLPLLFISLGTGWAISAIAVYFSDVKQVVPVLTQIVFWSSGVFFSSHRVVEFPAIWNILKWNPVFLGIENTRRVVIWHVPPDMGQLLYLWGLSLIFLLAGYKIFSNLKDGFSEML